MTQLSQHFSLAEFVRSQTATRHGIDNTPPGSAQINLARLAEQLERVRMAVGSRSVQITSGYRCPALNARIGGSRTSAHMEGRAADIVVRGMTAVQVARAIERASIVFDQLIFEGAWVHVGISRVGDLARGDVLTAIFEPGRPVRYQHGIVASA